MLCFLCLFFPISLAFKKKNEGLIAKLWNKIITKNSIIISVRSFVIVTSNIIIIINVIIFIVNEAN